MERIFSLLLLFTFALNAMDNKPEPNNPLALRAPTLIRNIKLVSQIIVTINETNQKYSTKPSPVFTHTAVYRQDPENENKFKLTKEEFKDNNQTMCKIYENNDHTVVAFSTEHYSANAKIISVNQTTQKPLIHYTWKAKGDSHMVRLLKDPNDNSILDPSFCFTNNLFDSQKEFGDPIEIGFGESSSLTISPVGPQLKTSFIETDDAELKITAYNMDSQN